MRVLGTFESPNGPTWSVQFSDLDDELRFLRRVIAQYRGVPAIRNLATKILRDYGCPARDQKCQAIAIGSWVQNNIYYVRELPERFQYPDETIRTQAGDCDDFTTLTGAMLESIGIPSVIVPMNVDGQWNHIFIAAAMPNARLLPLDGTMRFPVSEGMNPITVAVQRGKRVSIKLT